MEHTQHNWTLYNVSIYITSDADIHQEVSDSGEESTEEEEEVDEMQADSEEVSNVESIARTVISVSPI